MTHSPADAGILQASLASDGSAGVAGAGSAALLRIPQTDYCLKLTAILGPADPVESELLAGILGLTAYDLQELPPETELKWCCDSEAVVRGSTIYLADWEERGWLTLQDKPVRHVELWKVFRVLMRRVRFDVAAPRGSRQGRDHHACDKASRWAAQKGASLLAGGSPRLLGRNAVRDPSRAWLLLDFRRQLKIIRAGAPAEEVYSDLRAWLSAALQVRTSSRGD